MSVPQQDEGAGLRGMPFGGVLLVASALTGLVACGGSSGTQAPARADAPSLTTDVPGQIPDTGNPRGDAGTLSFDVTASANEPTTQLLVGVGSPMSVGRLNVFENQGNLYAVVSDSAGQESILGISVADWEPGQLHVITFTWGGGEQQVYVDGQFIGQVGHLSDFQLQPGTPVYSGSDGQGVPPATGTVSNFHAFNRPLTSEEVAMLYGPAGPSRLATPTPAVPRGAPGAPEAALRVQSISLAAPESAGSICVELTGSDGLIAGTQNELVWDPACLTIASACQANPQHGKSVRTGVPYQGRLRTIVFSLTDTNPIDNGLLYCCPYQVVSLASGGCCAVGLQAVLGSDPVGDAIPMDAIDGQICLR
jgi:hypothetical protein